jgi:hypothetical protein
VSNIKLLNWQSPSEHPPLPTPVLSLPLPASSIYHLLNMPSAFLFLNFCFRMNFCFKSILTPFLFILVWLVLESPALVSVLPLLCLFSSFHYLDFTLVFILSQLTKKYPYCILFLFYSPDKSQFPWSVFLRLPKTWLHFSFPAWFPIVPCYELSGSPGHLSCSLNTHAH